MRWRGAVGARRPGRRRAGTACPWGSLVSPPPTDACGGSREQRATQPRRWAPTGSPPPPEVPAGEAPAAPQPSWTRPGHCPPPPRCAAAAPRRCRRPATCGCCPRGLAPTAGKYPRPRWQRCPASEAQMAGAGESEPAARRPRRAGCLLQPSCFSRGSREVHAPRWHATRKEAPAGCLAAWRSYSRPPTTDWPRPSGACMDDRKRADLEAGKKRVRRLCPAYARPVRRDVRPSVRDATPSGVP